MLIVTFELRTAESSVDALAEVLRAAGGLQLNATAWVVPQSRGADAMADMLLKHLDEDADLLFVGVLDELGEFGWANPQAGDQALGMLIRYERETPQSPDA